MKKNAIILCSGGLDSVTAAYYAKKILQYSRITVLFFNYNQKSLKSERKFSKLCASRIGAEFIEVSLPELAKISTSLINKKGDSNRIKIKDLKNTWRESKNWYVPCRNQIFLSYSMALAESIFLKSKIKSDILAGFKCEGNDSYPDTTKKFVNKINSLSNLSTIGKFKVIAPLINKDKEDIIQLLIKLKINPAETFSCYVDSSHCGYCLSCRLRQEGFYWANVNDPTYYKIKMADFRAAKQ